MSGTPETQAALLASLADNQAPGSITPAIFRNIVKNSQNVPIDSQTVSYTLVLADAGEVVEVNSASATNVTVPPNASVALPVGQKVWVRQIGLGQVTVVAGAGVTIAAPPGYLLLTSGQNAKVELHQNAANSWIASGDLQPVPLNTPAMSNAQLLSTLGVNVHVSQGQAPDIATTVAADLAAVGVAFVRDTCTTNSTWVTSYQAIAAKGIKFVFQTNQDIGQTLTVSAQLTAYTTLVDALGPNSIMAFEAPNEPAIETWTYNGNTSTLTTAPPGWLPVAQFMAAMYTGIRSTPALNGIPYIQTTLQGEEPDNTGLQFLSIPYGYSHLTMNTNGSTANGNSTLHFASVTQGIGSGGLIAGHYIYGTNIPSGTTISSTTGTTVVMSAPATGSGVANGASIRFGARMPDGTTFADILNEHEYAIQSNNNVQAITPPKTDDLFAEVATTWEQGYPGYITLANIYKNRRIITEYGCAVGTPSANGFLVDARTQAANLLNAWLDYVLIWGYDYFCIYEMYDETNESPVNWGLYSAAATPRTSGTWLGNLTTILADNTSPSLAAKFAPGPLRYAVLNLPGGGTAFTRLLQRSDGTFFILAWNNYLDWNISTGAPITVTTTNVTVVFANAGSINVYDPSISGTAAQQTLTGNVVTIALGDYPQVITFM